MSYQVDPAKKAVAMIQQTLVASQSVEIAQWNQMTDEVCSLVQKISSVTEAVLAENAQLSREMIAAKANRERQQGANRALLQSLLQKIVVLDKELENIEAKIKQIKLDISPEKDKAKISCYLWQYKEAIAKIREYYLVHQHPMLLSGNKGTGYATVSGPKN